MIWWIIIAQVVLAVLAYRLPTAAVFGAALAAFGLALVAGDRGDYASAWIAPWLFVATLMLVVLFRGSPDREQSIHKLAKVMLIVLAFLWIIVAGGPSLGWLLAIPSGLLLLLFTAALIRAAFTTRRAVTSRLISTVSSCMKRNLPLSDALLAAGAGRTDKEGRLLRRIGVLLDAGCPLSEAFRRAYWGCPGHVRGVIAAAERANQLPEAVELLADELVSKSRNTGSARPVNPVYLFVLVSWAFFVISGMMYIVMPKFAKIFRDYNVELPASTRSLFLITDIWRWAWTPVMLLVLFVAFPLGLYVRIRPRTPGTPRVLSMLGDFIKWHLPGFRWFERNYSMARVVESLRLSLKAGCGIDVAIGNALQADTNICFRRRVRRWSQLVACGQDVADAARETGLGRSLAWAFDNRVNPGNAPAVLEMLSTFHRDTYNYRIRLAKLIGLPCLMVVVGAGVGFIVYAMFAPLIALISSLTMEVIP